MNDDALDPAWEQEMQKISRREGRVFAHGDSFDKFLRLQRRRLANRFDTSVRHVLDARDDTDSFESRK